jgi:uncharacterized protein
MYRTVFIIYFRNKTMTTQAHTALITGASAGIGAVYADRLAAKGYNLILVARNLNNLNKVAEQVSSQYAVNVDILQADLTNDADIQKIQDRITADTNIELLINNAGMGAASSLLESDLNSMATMININATSLTKLALTAAKAFTTKGTGTIVNIASVLALNPEMFNGVYNATKSYVMSFSQSLQFELKDSAIKVQVVLPGATSTPFWDNSGMPISYLPTEMVMDAEAMVDAALVGLENGELITIPSLPEMNDWNDYLSARDTLKPNLSRSQPADRYIK